MLLGSILYTVFFERHQDLASIEFVFHGSCLVACIPDILQKSNISNRALLELTVPHVLRRRYKGTATDT